MINSLSSKYRTRFGQKLKGRNAPRGSEKWKRCTRIFNVLLQALDERHIQDIARIQLGYLEKRLAQLEMRLEVEDSALAELAKAGFDPVYGARPLKRAIQQELENPLAKAILEGRFAAKDTIRVRGEGRENQFWEVS
jgi:ATP-dependent Clp protease ATP-binding subunit ClpA